MAETKKAAFLQAKGYSMISNGTATATSLAPNERVPFNEEDPQHKYERQLAETGDEKANYMFVEVDLKAEADQAEEREEMLAKAADIAAEARNEQAEADVARQLEQAKLQEQAQQEGQPAATAGTNFPPQDQESIRLAEAAGQGQRASTQEDVVPDPAQPKPKAKAKAKPAAGG